MKTLKAAVAKYNSISLILRILVGLAVGVVLALVAPGAGWVAEFGSLFVGQLFGGIVTHQNRHKVKRRIVQEIKQDI